MPATSPVQHALSITELLFRIFLYSTNQSNTVNARVCKLWSNEALSVNWYSIDAGVLLNLLEPLEEGTGLGSDTCATCTDDLAHYLQWRFGIPSTEAWARFDEYARRVRILSFRPNADFPYIVFNQVLNMTFDRNLSLVPNLTALTIDFEPYHTHHIINLFGHSLVRSLTLGPYTFDEFWQYPEPLEMALTIFKSALINMPSLRIFRASEYDESEESSTVVQAFASIVGGFDKLQEVQTPTFWLTDPVVDSLASLPGLRSLELSTFDTPSPARFATMPVISNNYYPSLETLDIATSFSKATKWFSHPRFPKTLTSIYIYLRQYEGEGDQMVDGWAHLLEVIGSQLRSLRTLVLEEASDRFSPPPFL